MVYRGLDIGTAKPAAGFASRRAASPDRHSRSERSVLGGTFRARCGGGDSCHRRARAFAAAGRRHAALSAGAARWARISAARRRPEVRRQLDAEAAATSWAAQHERLRGVDPEAAARIAPTDRQRIQRALEVYVLTGQPLSRLQREAKVAPALQVQTIALVPGATRGPCRTHRAALRCDGRRRPRCGSGAVARTRRPHAGDAVDACRRLPPDLGLSGQKLRLGRSTSPRDRRDAPIREASAHMAAWRSALRGVGGVCTRLDRALCQAPDTWRHDRD